jgi:hypothetical protein
LIITFVRERVANNLLQIDYVPTGDQVVDGFIKAKTIGEFQGQSQPCPVKIEGGC